MAEKTENHPLRICDCGLAEYRGLLQLQHRLREKVSRGKTPDTVFIAEHPPVITLGARQSANKLLASRSTLAKRVSMWSISDEAAAQQLTIRANWSSIRFCIYRSLASASVNISESLKRWAQSC